MFYEEVAEKLNQKCYERNAYWFYDQVRPILPILNDMLKTIKQGDVEFKKNNLTLADMENDALDFYYDLDPEFEEKIGNVLEDLDHTIMYVGNPSEKGGKNAVGLKTQIGKRGPLKNSPKVEIELHPTNNTDGIIQVGHEFGHTLNQRIQERKHPISDCIQEVETMFFEKVYADWLLKKKKITKEEHANLIQKRKNSFYAEVKTLLEEDELLRRLDKPITAERLISLEKEIAQQDVHKLEILKRRIDVMINGRNGNTNAYGQYEFRYVLGEIVAQALYEDYKKDPKKTITNLKQYLKNSADYDFMPMKTKKINKKEEKRRVLDKNELDKCFGTLLGENYEKKIKNILFSNLKNKTA